MYIKGREIPKNDKRKVVRVKDDITIITPEFTFIIVSAKTLTFISSYFCLVRLKKYFIFRNIIGYESSSIYA